MRSAPGAKGSEWRLMTPTRCSILLGVDPSAGAIALWACLARPAAGAVAGAIDARIPVAAVGRRELAGVGVQGPTAVAMPAAPILVRALLALLAVLAPPPQLG